jgi:hypothetical protein
MFWGFDNHYFQSGPNMTSHKMPAPSTSDRFADDKMDVDFGFIVFKRAITDEGQNLNLLIERNWPIIFGFPVEKTQPGTAECSDPRHRLAPSRYSWANFRSSDRASSPVSKIRA